ncbi:hypothetical protein LDL59_12835 [Kaistella anthropi]|nr:hypothetical protein [Kaistella anthropi]
MKSLKIHLDENASFEKLTELFLQIKGIKSVEIIDDENTESDLKKHLPKAKNN